MIAASVNSSKFTVASLLLLLVAWTGAAAADEVAVHLFTHRVVDKIALHAPGWEVTDGAGHSAPATNCEIVLAGFHRAVTCGDFRSQQAPFDIRPRAHDAAAAATIRLGNEARAYPGRLRLEAGRDRWTPVVYAPLEEYVAGVVAAESPADDPQFLRLMAVCARSYARHHLATHNGKLADDTQSQQYRGNPPAARARTIREAVAATQGRVLRVNGRVAPAFYHACCGGHTRPADELWPSLAAWPHLRGVKDVDPAKLPWCRDDKWFSWRRELPLDRWRRFLHDKYSALTAVRSEEAHVVTLVDAERRRMVLAWPFRLAACRELGWNTLPSDRFVIETNRHAVVFTGHGFGHRVGLCQAGALAQVRSGKSCDEVLAFYFPGALVR